MSCSCQSVINSVFLKKVLESAKSEFLTLKQLIESVNVPSKKLSIVYLLKRHKMLVVYLTQIKRVFGLESNDLYAFPFDYAVYNGNSEKIEFYDEELENFKNTVEVLFEVSSKCLKEK